ncbi:glycosyl transferase, group 2 family protein [gut metagenome]|uniref:Glycosyl transferase, group 2 family protein n=1 Tax=gut metagenome TaxID=749906 RepID=J9GCS8_9ZZZZ
MLLWIEKTAGRLPFTCVLGPVLLFYWLSDARLRRVSLDWLSSVNRYQPFLEKKPGWIEGLRHLARFADTILDKFLASTGRLQSDALSVENDASFRHDPSDRGAVVLTSHVGCQELLSAVSGQFTRHEIVVLQHTAHAKNFHTLLNKAGIHRSAIHWIEVSTITPATAMDLAERVEAGAYIIIAGDRVPVGSQKGRTTVTLMGRPAYLPTGGALLALLLHCPLRMMTTTRNPPGKGLPRYRVRFESIDESPSADRKERAQWLQKAMQTYASALEKELLRSPYDWFNFFDFWADTDPTAHRADQSVNQ